MSVAGSSSLGIIADDLTGAMDVTAPFAVRGLRSFVALSMSAGIEGAEWDVLCYNTNTRNISEVEAVERVSRATESLLKRGVARLCKKIDSTMRGHVGAEVVAMLAASSMRCALICPAFPAMGRTVRNGTLHVNGKPVSEVSEGRDALSAVPSSSIVEVLKRQTGENVGQVSLLEVARGDDSIEAQVDALVKQNFRLIVLDAEEQAHLESIANVILGRYPNCIASGSAGLAISIAEQLRNTIPNARECFRPRLSQKPFLLVSGSVNPVTQSQLERVNNLSGLRLVAINAEAVVHERSGWGTEIDRILREGEQASNTKRDFGILLRATDSGLTRSISPLGASRILWEFLHALIVRLTSEVEFSGMVLIGGDTANACLSALNVEGIEVLREIETGIPLGIVRGGNADGRFVVTKAGGFGDAESLIRVVEYLTKLRSLDS